MDASNKPKEPVVRLRFRSEVGRIPMVVDQIMSVVRQSDCVLGQEIEVELALAEALTNAVVHGNRMDPDKWVHVRCGCDPREGVAIVVRDEGRGFDPDRVAATVTSEGNGATRGAGILIMQSYMDGVSFERGGTEVHLRKDPAVAGLGSSHPRSHTSSGPQPQAGSGSGELLQRSVA